MINIDDAQIPAPFNLSKFSLRGKSEQMKLKMLKDCFVLDRIAILGQATVIYAKPNTGKTLLTLWMLVESIKARAIDGERVFYVNADDDYKGLVQKAEMAEQYGFHMLAPNHEGLKSNELVGHLEQMVVDDTARKSIIILDTLKKFCDLMDKKRSGSFMTKAREFVSNGGTMILLAHTNKNRDANGKAIFGGTSDVVDDCDCVFILDEIAREGNYKRVFFENIKSRGDVASELAFKYSIEDGKHYQYRFDSVEMADQIITVQAKVDKEYWDGRDKNRLAIDAITEAIESEVNLKTELIKVAHENSGISKSTLHKVLDRYKGKCIGFDTKDLGRETTGVKNAKSYVLGNAPEATKEQYSRHKDGE